MHAPTLGRITLLDALNLPLVGFNVASHRRGPFIHTLDSFSIERAHVIQCEGPLPIGTFNLQHRAINITKPLRSGEKQTFRVNPIDFDVALRFDVRDVGLDRVAETNFGLSRDEGVMFIGDANEAPKPPGPNITVPCGRDGCSYTTVTAIGMPDPTEVRCTHSMRLEHHRGTMGMLTCTNCTMAIDMRDVRRALEKDPYDQRSNTLADEAQKLRDENRTVLVENAQLRREVETLQRKAKGKR